MDQSCPQNIKLGFYPHLSSCSISSTFKFTPNRCQEIQIQQPNLPQNSLFQLEIRYDEACRFHTCPQSQSLPVDRLSRNKANTVFVLHDSTHLRNRHKIGNWTSLLYHMRDLLFSYWEHNVVKYFIQYNGPMGLARQPYIIMSYHSDSVLL